MGAHQGHFAARWAAATLVLVGLAAGACSGEPTVGSTDAAVSSTGEPTATTATSVVDTAAQTAGQAPPSSATSTSSPPASTSTTEVDRTAPPLVVLSPEQGATHTHPEVRLEGSTEAGAVVLAWDRWAATVAADGTWSIVLILEPGTNVARLTATTQPETPRSLNTSSATTRPRHPRHRRLSRHRPRRRPPSSSSTRPRYPKSIGRGPVGFTRSRPGGRMPTGAA